MQNVAAARAMVRSSRAIAGLAARQFAVLGVALILASAGWRHIAALDPSAMLLHLAAVPAVSWLAAAAAALASYWAAGRFEVLVHRHFATGTCDAIAHRGGLAATALSQACGSGLLSGTLVRMRMLPGFGLPACLRLTVGVSVLFLGCWTIVASIVVLIAEAPVPEPARLAAWAILVLGAPAGLAASLLKRGAGAERYTACVPTLPLLAGMLPLAAIDLMLCFGSLALVLVPMTDLSPAILLPAFLLAYGAGLASGSPAGLGVFETVLFSLLPGAAQPETVAAILAWRLIYHAAPAVSALVILGRPQTRQAQAIPTLLPGGTASLQAVTGAALWRSARAELGLLHQKDKLLLSDAQGAPAGVVGRTGQTLAMIGFPLDGSSPARAHWALSEAARAEGRLPVLYKCGRRQAAGARRCGWRVVAVAEELHLSTAGYDTEGAAFRQLRRKLRKAEMAGLRVRECPAGRLPGSLAEIAAEWAEARGGERGFSMGRFDPAYLARQRVFVASCPDGDVAFLTLHACAAEWTVDLLRVRTDAPDGTVHTLVDAAIRAARLAGVGRVSLAALPHPVVERLVRRMPGPARRALSSGGLAQFKRSFAPASETLYLAAPGRASLLLAAAEIARAIRWPAPPLASRDPDSRIATGTGEVREMTPAHHRHAGFRIAPQTAACQEVP